MPRVLSRPRPLGMSRRSAASPGQTRPPGPPDRQPAKRFHLSPYGGFAMPSICVACGAPALGEGGSLYKVGVSKTHVSLTLAFPICSDCTAAKAKKAKLYVPPGRAVLVHLLAIAATFVWLWVTFGFTTRFRGLLDCGQGFGPGCVVCAPRARALGLRSQGAPGQSAQRGRAAQARAFETARADASRS